MINENHIPDRDDDIEGYIKIDRYNPELIHSLSGHYHEVLKQIGEKPEREGLLKTPERVAKAMLYLPRGMSLTRMRSLTRRCLKKSTARWLL